MADLQYDAEFWQVFEPYSAIKKPEFEDIDSFRVFQEALMRGRLKDIPQSTKITTTKHEIESVDGSKINIERFLPSELADSKEPQPAIVYVHGGGMIFGAVDIFRPVTERYAESFGRQIFAVDYRLAPEHPFPAAVEDTLASIQWLQAHAQELNIDPARIALMGASAGGGIAVGAALMARDHGLDHPLARLVLLYPMLDDRTNLAADNPLHRYVTWSAHDNDMGWKSYLGGRDRQQRGDDVSIYAAPGRADTLEGLPPTYIDVGGFDLFVNEVTAFVAKLAQANNHVEFHLYPGVTHGFEGIAPQTRVVKDAVVNRSRVLTSF